MSPLDANPIHRGPYLGLMLGAICLGVAAGIGAVMLAGGSTPTATWASVGLSIACLPTILPAILHVRPSNWGTLVFASSAARLLLMIGVGFAIVNGQSVDRKPFWVAMLTGAIVVLLIETIVASLTIARRERSRDASDRPVSQPQTMSPQTMP